MGDAFKGRFKSKVALITGATSGIGAATARRMGAEGARVVCVGRDSERGRAITREISRLGGESTFVRADVTRARQVEASVKSAIEVYGKMDILFNNAGMLLVRKSTEMTEDEWDRTVDTNLKSAFLYSKYSLPWLRKTRGVIINAGSELSLIGAPKYAAYCASKGGVVMLTRAMAVEFAPLKVRVNCVCPGATKTGMLEGEFEYYTKETGRFPSKRAAAKFLKDMIPLGRIAAPEEVANVVTFLASGEASYMTGAVVSVDAGTTAK